MRVFRSAVVPAIVFLWIATVGGCSNEAGRSAVTATFVVTGGSIVNLGATVNFDASSSSGVVGSDTYDWEFGDGTTAAGQTAATASNQYTASGVYDVTLTIKDASGNTLVRITVIGAVQVVDPSLTPGNAINGLPGGPVASPATVTLDAGSLTAPGAQTITSITWNWGDGSTDTSAPTGSVTHTYVAGGTYTVTAVVHYNDGTAGSVTATVEVTGGTLAGAATQLVIVSVSPGSTVATNQLFTVTVQRQDAGGVPVTGEPDLSMTLSGAGIGGNVTGRIQQGNDSVTVTGVLFTTAGDKTLTAAATALTSGTKAMTVFAPSMWGTMTWGTDNWTRK